MEEFTLHNTLLRLGGPFAPSLAGICGELSAMSNLDKAAMPKRFYLSTRKDRAAQARSVATTLTAHGWEQTFVWTDEELESSEAFARTAVAELAGVRDADVLIVLLPGGYGTHVEIGAALALGKLVILHAPDRKTLETPYPCVFHYHPRVKLLVSQEPDVLAILAFMEAALGETAT
jgi:nucleoside 2-deoxyribosyltransferase